MVTLFFTTPQSVISPRAGAVMMLLTHGCEVL